MDHPNQGFGVYKLGVIPSRSSQAKGKRIVLDQDLTEIIGNAVKAGFRLLDCAEFYENNREVGEAIHTLINDKVCTREDLYIVNKVWVSTIYEGRQSVQEKVKEMLLEMNLEYFDLCLVHWPVPGKHIEAYDALQSLKDEGIVRDVGVSNYTIEDYQDLESSGVMRYEPKVNQIEFNPFLFRPKTLEFFKSKGIIIQGYRVLGDGKVMEHSLLKQIAIKFKTCVSKILVKFAIQSGVIPLTKTATQSRLQDNYLDEKRDNFGIVEEDMKLLQELTSAETLEAFKKRQFSTSTSGTPLQHMKPEETGFRFNFTVA